MHKKYLKDIEFDEHKDDLIDVIDMIMCIIQEKEDKLYNHTKIKLYEMAYGKTINENMAIDWVKNMKPKGEHWNIEESTEAMRDLDIQCEQLDFYVVANMMYNDYYNIVKGDETLALRLADDWLNDEDAKKDKLYEYWKHIVKKD